MWYWHDTEVSISPIDIVLICSSKALCLLEEWQHISPAPSWISKFLPLLKVLTVPAEVQHPIKHAEKLMLLN